MIPPVIRTALTPYLKLAFNAWKTADDPSHVVLVLQGSGSEVCIYALSPVDAQIALAAADIESETLARITVEIGKPADDGRFWLVYILPTCLGLVAFKWREHVARAFN